MKSSDESIDNNNDNEIGKEYYFTGELRFEGEYLNGKKSGKGKEYDRSGKLIFEGEYLNGLINGNGKGKEYDKEGLIIFEGQFKEGAKISSTQNNKKIT